MFKYIKLLVLLLCFCVFACNTTNNKPLSIHFSSDSTQIIINHIAPVGLLQIKNNLTTDSAYQGLVTVLQIPTDSDSLSMEVDWPGQLYVSGNRLIFAPKTPFVPGKSYLVQTIINSKFATGKEIISGQVGHKVKTQQEVLKR